MKDTGGQVVRRFHSDLVKGENGSVLLIKAVDGKHRIDQMFEGLSEVVRYASNLSEEDRAVAGFGQQSARIIFEDFESSLGAVDFITRKSVERGFSDQLSRLIRGSIENRGNRANFGLIDSSVGSLGLSGADTAACSDLKAVPQSQLSELRLVAPQDCRVCLLNEVPFTFSLDRIDSAC